jgi:pimeloyl-ACP methyl ester carboxylesterase
MSQVSLRFHACGSGTPLVLLHAFPLSGAMWEPCRRRLARSTLLVTPHLRGFGASPAAGTAAMEEMADDTAALLDRLQIRETVLGGCSMGGYVAFAFWKRHRARVRGLLLSNTRAAPDTEAQRAGRAEFAEAVLKGGPAVAADRMLPKLLGPEAGEPARRFVRDLIERNRPEGIAAALRGLGERADARPLLETISVPALVIGGGRDEVVPPAETREMAAGIRGARLVEMPGAGHLTSVEAPEAWGEAVVAWLAETGLAPRDSMANPATGVLSSSPGCVP